MLAQGAAAISIASVSVATVPMWAIIKIAICVNLPTSGEPLLMHGEAYNRVIIHRRALGKRREAGTRFYVGAPYSPPVFSANPAVVRPPQLPHGFALPPVLPLVERFDIEPYSDFSAK